jgi:glycosyltransferase involved in cell wall biosynthesis
LFFGRIQKYKGLKILIEAEKIVSKAMPELKIIVAGTGDELKKYAPKMKSNPHYEIHDGFIPNSTVGSYFQRASIIVLPYIEASQSGVVAMAFAFGKPVIVTDVGSLAEMVKNNYTGIIIPPNNKKALATAIIRLLNDTDERIRMGINALKVAQNDLSWENVAMLTKTAYKKRLEYKLRM